MKQEDGLRDLRTGSQSGPVDSGDAGAGAGGQMVQDDQVRVLLEEKMNISMKSDGSIDVMEVKGRCRLFATMNRRAETVQLSHDSAGARRQWLPVQDKLEHVEKRFLEDLLIMLEEQKRDYPLGKPTTGWWRFSSNDDSSILSPSTVGQKLTMGKINVNVNILSKGKILPWRTFKF